jgi:hypothetical protein
MEQRRGHFSRWLDFQRGPGRPRIGLCSFLWPNFEVFGDYVLRAPVDVERLRGWEKVSDISRGDIETAMNAYLLDDVFPQDQTNGELKQAQCERLAGIMAKCSRRSWLVSFLTAASLRLLWG